MFFALILGAVLHTLLETYIEFEVFLDKYLFLRITIILSEVVIWIILIGFSIEKYLMFSNKDLMTGKIESEFTN
jgi:hypothetical protein